MYLTKLNIGTINALLLDVFFSSINTGGSSLNQDKFCIVFIFERMLTFYIFKNKIETIKMEVGRNLQLKVN